MVHNTFPVVSWNYVHNPGRQKYQSPTQPLDVYKRQNYDNTNKFYISLGFKEFEIFPTLWDEWNPCQVYVMALL